MTPTRLEVNSLLRNLWFPADRKTIVCIDSYEDGIFQGRLSYPSQCIWQPFSSLSQFLLLMESTLESRQNPQSYTQQRSFSGMLPANFAETASCSIRRGTLATFELQILFRQHASWQGVVLWLERQKTQKFRSVLELILLMNSALQEPDRLTYV